MRNEYEEDEAVIDDDELNIKMRSLMSKHKQMKKREFMDKELSKTNTLLSKYDTTRVLAIKARTKLAEQREMEKEINRTVTNNEDGDEKEFLDRVAGYDFSENVLASPQRGTIRPRSAPGQRRKDNNGKAAYMDNYNPVTPKSDKKIKKAKKNAHNTDIEFYSPPEYPSPLQKDGIYSPTIGARQKAKKKPKEKLTYATFDPDEWWIEQKKQNPNAAYRVAIRRSHSDPVLKRPKSASSIRRMDEGEKAMSTKDLKSYLNESRNSKTRPPSARMYLAEYKKKKQQEKEAILSAIVDEANNRETKVHVCLDEANSYAKYLGLTRRFSLYWRAPDLNSKNVTAYKKADSRPMNTYEMSKTVGKTDPNTAIDSLIGTGRRIEKMMVEVFEARGEATKLMSVDNFFKEHEQLQLDVRRKRNLMSTEQRVQEDREEKNKSKEANAKRKGVMDKQEAFLQHLEKIKAKETAKAATKSSSKIRRKETEEKVNKILDNTANVTKILQEQLRELQSRGWNEST